MMKCVNILKTLGYTGLLSLHVERPSYMTQRLGLVDKEITREFFSGEIMSLF